MRKKLIIFLLILGLFGGAIIHWYYQQRVFSKAVLKLEILGPESIQMGQDFEYTVRYKNNGNFVLEEPRLIFEYPKYSLSKEGKRRVTKELEKIYPGEERIIKFKAKLLGKEEELKEAKAWLSYRPRNLKAFYESQTSFVTKIEPVPLTLEFDLPSKLENEKEIQFLLNYFSNLDYPLSEARIIVEYPGGFKFLESFPEALEKTEWEIPYLKKAEGGRIKIKGILSGQPGEYLDFKAKLGIWLNGEFVLLKETKKEVVIIKPLLYLSQQINGFSNYIASPGEVLNYEIFFRNIGNTSFENLFLLVRLEGEAFDLSTLKSELGEVKPNDNLIIWDWKRVPELRFLDVNVEGKVKFEVKLKEVWSLSEGGKNITIKTKVNLAQVNQEFQTKVNSKLEISQKGYYNDEIFGNSGPFPPKVAERTTFTITWQVKNHYNDVRNVKVKALLPEGVELTGKIFPNKESSKFSFDSQSREIVWIVEEKKEKEKEILRAGTGVLGPGPNVSFQLALTPALNQKGKILTIISEAEITGEDLWTGKDIKGKASLIDTTLVDDQLISDHSGFIQ